MSNIKIMKMTEVELKVPVINSNDCLSASSKTSVNCGGIDCEDCIFNGENFKALMKTLQKQENE